MLALAQSSSTIKIGYITALSGVRANFGEADEWTLAKFKAADVEVVAISTDKQDESTRFRTEYKMPFGVLGDPEHKVIDAFGVPLMVRGDAQYAQRSVVLIDKDGKVAYIDQDYKIGEDEKPLFEAIDKLKAKASPIEKMP